MIGNNPTFDPALLQSPAAGALGNLYVAASSAPFSSKTPKAVEIATAYKAANPNSPVNGGVDVGYVEGLVWQSVLTKACENEDLTRTGVQTALKSLTSVETEDLVAPLDYSSPGSPPTRGVYIAKVDPAAEGGLTEVAAAVHRIGRGGLQGPVPEVASRTAARWPCSDWIGARPPCCDAGGHGWVDFPGRRDTAG